MKTVFVIKAYDPPSIEGVYETLEAAEAAAAKTNVIGGVYIEEWTIGTVEERSKFVEVH